MPGRLGDKLAPLLGAGPGEVVVTDTTSLNLFKALAAALRIQQASRPERRVIVSERDNFPTDLYMVQGMIDFLQQGYELRLVDADHPLEDALDEDVAVVSLSHVNYRTGRDARHGGRDRAGAPARRARALGPGAFGRRGAGRSHAAPTPTSPSGAPTSTSNGGPGAPAFIWVSPRHQDRFWQPLSGWWGHDKRRSRWPPTTSRRTGSAASSAARSRSCPSRSSSAASTSP